NVSYSVNPFWVSTCEKTGLHAARMATKASVFSDTFMSLLWCSLLRILAIRRRFSNDCWFHAQSNRAEDRVITTGDQCTVHAKRKGQGIQQLRMWEMDPVCVVCTQSVRALDTGLWVLLEPCLSMSGCLLRPYALCRQSVAASEMSSQIAEAFHLQQANTVGRSIYRLSFQYPGHVMRHKNGIDAGCQRRIDVRSRAVADHPCGLRIKLVLGHDLPVSGRILLRHNFHRSKIVFDPGALHFSRLFRDVALG